MPAGAQQQHDTVPTRAAFSPSARESENGPTPSVAILTVETGVRWHMTFNSLMVALLARLNTMALIGMSEKGKAMSENGAALRRVFRGIRHDVHEDLAQAVDDDERVQYLVAGALITRRVVPGDWQEALTHRPTDVKVIVELEAS